MDKDNDQLIPIAVILFLLVAGTALVLASWVH